MRIAIWLKLCTACIDFVLSIYTLLNWSKFISRLSLNPNQVIWNEGIYSNSNHQILSKWYDFSNLLIPSSDIKENLKSALFWVQISTFAQPKAKLISEKWFTILRDVQHRNLILELLFREYEEVFGIIILRKNYGSE